MLDNHLESCCSEYGNDKTAMTKQIFDLILNEWMFGYGTIHTTNNYKNLYCQLLQLVCKGMQLHFMLPGFPVKSPNTRDKVLSEHADFAEYLGLQTLISTSRKINEIYTPGVLITIMSDYHTFDQYLGVSEKNYNTYHQDIKRMILNAKADDIIQVISLSSFPEFKDTPSCKLSNKLNEDYGNENYLQNFDDMIKNDCNILAKYKQLLKFMTKDQVMRLPGSPRSKQSRKELKHIVRGMMCQGVALDNFLKQQTFLKNYIRLSIHHHNPSSNKFAIDLFKKCKSKDNVLRTPWHHVVMYDAMQGEFIITQKDRLLSSRDTHSYVWPAKYQGVEWFYIKVDSGEKKKENRREIGCTVNISFVKENHGLIFTNKSSNDHLIKPDFIDNTSYVNLVREFGFVNLKGFDSFGKVDVPGVKMYTSKDYIVLTPDQFNDMKEAELTAQVHKKKVAGRAISLPSAYQRSARRYRELTFKDYLVKCKNDTFVAASSMKEGLKHQWHNTVNFNGVNKQLYDYPLDIEYEQNIVKRTRSWKGGFPIKRQRNLSLRV